MAAPLAGRGDVAGALRAQVRWWPAGEPILGGTQRVR